MAAMAVNAGTDIEEINPYEGHPELSTLEANVLWEYAKLAKNVKTALHRTRELGGAPDQALLEQLRVLERKLGLVLTLFKASVWAAINEKQAAEEEEDAYNEGETVYDRTITS